MDIDKIKPIKYIDYKIYNVTTIKKKYGFRVKLLLENNTEKEVQHAGFEKKNLAVKERNKIIGQLENKTYVVYNNISVEEYLKYWFKYDAPNRIKSYNSYMSYRNAIFNHIIQRIGKVKLLSLSKTIIEKLYKEVFEYSRKVADIVKTVMVSALADAVKNKFIPENVAYNVKLPKTDEQKINEKTKNDPDIKYHTLVIDERKTFTIEQVATIIRASRNTPIYINVLFSSLMGLRKSEILGIKYSDIDFMRKKLKLHIQLGRRIGDTKGIWKPKTLTKQEVKLKTKSSERELDIPDIVFEAILEARALYEKRRNRRKNDKTNPFCDEGYVCCSTYGKPRSRGFVNNYFKKIKEENNLPDLPWHKLRTTYTTILAKNDFSLKAIAVLLGHSSEIVTFENYTDKNEIIYDCITELEPFIENVLPTKDEHIIDCTDIETDIIMQQAFENILIA